jgi:hypothetical protein
MNDVKNLAKTIGDSIMIAFTNSNPPISHMPGVSNHPLGPCKNMDVSGVKRTVNKLRGTKSIRKNTANIRNIWAYRLYLPAREAASEKISSEASDLPLLK